MSEKPLIEVEFGKAIVSDYYEVVIINANINYYNEIYEYIPKDSARVVYFTKSVEIPRRITKAPSELIHQWDFHRKYGDNIHEDDVPLNDIK